MHTLLSKIGVASIRLALDNIEGSQIGHLMNFMDVGYKASDPCSKHHTGVFPFHFYITP